MDIGKLIGGAILAGGLVLAGCSQIYIPKAESTLCVAGQEVELGDWRWWVEPHSDSVLLMVKDAYHLIYEVRWKGRGEPSHGTESVMLAYLPSCD